MRMMIKQYVEENRRGQEGKRKGCDGTERRKGTTGPSGPSFPQCEGNRREALVKVVDEEARMMEGAQGVSRKGRSMEGKKNTKPTNTLEKKI